ncbi:ATP-binding cassette domain-containing protein [Corynebacterium sp. 4HC-13]|uniref:ABC transporter ATP-binding protein n=1 Tax=Corynebacterium anserum TaxID=2684406 RepID=UPI00163AF91F|nr:ABC transporter ATP-binding protein [Corynebacterium anserum]MBC2682239.1 ATP-binding cassette domain-containing protein [Corynebacterium anserum]
MISVTDLTVGYSTGVPVIRDLCLDIPEGKITTIIGPNGCGKSTLLRAMARIIPHTNGQVRLNGVDISKIGRKELAKKLAVLPQSPTAPEGILVSDLVARGRFPHQSWYAQWSSTDEKEVIRALELTNTSHLAHRHLDELSGGQRQSVWLSMVLAQNTDIVFLDEPTTHLDLANAVEVLELIRSLNNDAGRTIVMVLHDLNLACRYSDHLVVLSDGSLIAHGDPHSVVSPDMLERAFGLSAKIIPDPLTGGPLIIPYPRRI